MAANPVPGEFEIEPTEEPFDEQQDQLRYEISYYPSDMTLKGYQDKWDARQLVIPDFQRAYVWDQIRASKLVESFLLGLPVPGVFLYKERTTNKLLVIDGQQRILSAIRYFEGKFDSRDFELKNVDARWKGKTFQELLERDRLQLHDSVLRATVVQQLDPDDNTSVYHIFERLNTGGVKLSPMEIRKCVYSGTFFQLLETLNQNTDWQAILGRNGPDKRLRDVELVLRFLAMRDGWIKYEKPMKSFLNDFMVSKKKLSDTETEKISLMFNQTCADVVQQLGEKPFHLRPRALNPGMLDAVMVMMSFAREKGITDGGERYQSLRSDQTFLDAVRTRYTSETHVVRQRFEHAKQIMLG
jgi:uncharacterized protein with ParB-like and HNH nuclease domain